jgi:ABC-type sugar transport systems, permease components
VFSADAQRVRHSARARQRASDHAAGAIYSSATVDLDLPTAAAGAVVMLIMSLSLYALYRQVNRRKVKGAGHGR